MNEIHKAIEKGYLKLSHVWPTYSSNFFLCSTFKNSNHTDYILHRLSKKVFETVKCLELLTIQITLQDNEDDCYYNDLARDDKQLREQGGGKEK